MDFCCLLMDGQGQKYPPPADLVGVASGSNTMYDAVLGRATQPAVRGTATRLQRQLCQMLSSSLEHNMTFLPHRRTLAREMTRLTFARKTTDLVDGSTRGELKRLVDPELAAFAL